MVKELVDQTQPTRRKFLKGLGIASASIVGAGVLWNTPLFKKTSPKKKKVERIFVVSYGGSYGKFVDHYIAKPFTQATGIEVTLVNTPNIARVKAQVEFDHVEWDVYDGGGSMLLAASKKGLWEPLDPNLIDFAKFLTPIDSKVDDVVPTYIFSGGVAWNSNKIKQPPRNFSQMWDIDAFPGWRALRSSRASEMLEVALLADGVKPAQMYPLDVDRAFRSLEKIRPHVRKWFVQTGQMITLIQTEEVDITYAYTNRVKVAQENGIAIDMSFDQTVNVVNSLAVVRGSPRKEAAMRYINFATDVKQQLAVAEQLSVTPVVKGVREQVSPEAKKWMVDLNNPNSVFLKDQYWAEHHDQLGLRMREWILSG